MLIYNKELNIVKYSKQNEIGYDEISIIDLAQLNDVNIESGSIDLDKSLMILDEINVQKKLTSPHVPIDESNNVATNKSVKDYVDSGDIPGLVNKIKDNDLTKKNNFHNDTQFSNLLMYNNKEVLTKEYNEGMKWNQIVPFDTSADIIQILYVDYMKLYVAVQTKGLYISYDHFNWIKINISFESLSSTNKDCIITFHEKTKKIYLVIANNIYASENAFNWHIVYTYENKNYYINPALFNIEDRIFVSIQSTEYNGNTIMIYSDDGINWNKSSGFETTNRNDNVGNIIGNKDLLLASLNSSFVEDRNGLIKSTDYGKTWIHIYKPKATIKLMYYFNKQFIVVSDNTSSSDTRYEYMISDDLDIWTTYIEDFYNIPWYNMCYNPDKNLYLFTDYNNLKMYISSDAIHYEAIQLDGGRSRKSYIFYFNGIYLAFDHNYQYDYDYSYDGRNWFNAIISHTFSAQMNNKSNIIWDGHNTFIKGGNYGILAYSTANYKTILNNDLNSLLSDSIFIKNVNINVDKIKNNDESYIIEMIHKHKYYHINLKYINYYNILDTYIFNNMEINEQELIIQFLDKCHENLLLSKSANNIEIEKLFEKYNLIIKD